MVRFLSYAASRSLRQARLGEATQVMLPVRFVTVGDLGFESCQGKIGIDRENLSHMALSLFTITQPRVARR